MHIEFFAFSGISLPSPWPDCPRAAVQFTQPQVFYQPVVIPAKFPMPRLGAWHPRMDENSVYSPPPLMGEGEGGGE